MKIRAPAKINIRLRVVGKRKDGYHLLDTIMVPVSLYDEIEIRKLKAHSKKIDSQHTQIEVTSDHPSVPSGEKNLVYKAALALLGKRNIGARLRIHVRKRIPVGAGLGGGSSDAAATLMALNRLLKLGFSKMRLKRIAVGIGADVPFFLAGKPARARGIGERLTLLDKFPRLWLVILHPGLEIPTAWVYGKYQRRLTKADANTSMMGSLRSCKTIAAMMVNDLETVTLRRYPAIGLLKQQLLRHGAAGALMSGSGSAVFGLFEDKQKALRAFGQLRKKESIQAFLVRILG
jgi:4-diphosphocytidyl-2-C-methyl-D-erythritol kinase